MLQVQDQSLRPLTTAHLAQTMSLLALGVSSLVGAAILPHAGVGLPGGPA